MAAIPQATLDRFENHGLHLIRQAEDPWAARERERGRWDG
jgi:hypothetical protein